MLNKDEYNQDEYNDYYAQEIKGAEISNRGKSEDNGKKTTFTILLLLLITTLGYFGWKSINSSNSTPINIGDTNITSNDVTTQKNKNEITKKPIIKESTVQEPISKKPIEQKTPETQKKNITKEVQNVASNNNNGKMSPEDIANIVQIVMQKMNQEKNKKATTVKSETKPIEENIEELQDSKLMKSLSNSKIDSLSTVSDNVDAITEIDRSKQASNSDTPNTYNKVVVDEKSGKSSDELSKLSDEISSVINTEESKPKDNTNYTQEIAKEIKIRKKEMRYITVKKGDTLGKIAKRVYGNVMYYKKIYEANPDILRRPDRIYIGQKLRIPE